MRPWVREANGLSIDFMSQCKDEIQRKKNISFHYFIKLWII